MAQDAWPYGEQAINEGRWRAMARLWRETGVVEGVGEQLAVSAISGTLGVRVPSGEAWVDGHYFRNEGDVDLDVPTADLDDPRVDRVVVRSTADDGAELVYLEGTPDPSPSPPSLTQDHDDAGVYELLLADVDVPAATGDVDDGVTDRRRFSQVVGGVSIVSTAERDAIDDLYVGRVIFHADKDRLEVWDGTRWAVGGLRSVDTVADDAERDALDTWPGRVVYVIDDGNLDVWDDDAGVWRTTTPADGITEADGDARYVLQVGGSLRGYTEPGGTPGDSGTVDLDLSAYNVFEITPTGDVTITFSGLPSAGEHASATIIVKNADHAITWPSGTEHPGGDPPALDGKTYLSVVVEGDGTVVVGQAWAGVA